MKLIQTLNVYAVYCGYDASKSIEVTTRVLRTNDYQVAHLLSSSEIEIDVSEDYEQQLDLKIIEDLEGQKIKLLAATELKTNLIQRRINELQAIENRGK